MEFTDEQYERAYKAWRDCSGSTKEAFKAFMSEINKPAPIMCKHCGKELVSAICETTRKEYFYHKASQGFLCYKTKAEPA